MGGAELPNSEFAIQSLQDFEQQARRQLLGSVFPLKAGRFANHPAGNQMIGSPLFGAFLDRIAQASEDYQTKGTADERQKVLDRMAFLGNYVIAAALASGEIAAAKVWFENGQGMIPGYGLITLPGTDDLTIAQTTKEGGILLRSPESGVTGQIFADELSGSTDTWEPLRRFEAADMTITVDDIDPNRNIFRYPPADRLTDEEYNRLSSVIGKALVFIKTNAPDTFRLVKAALTTIVPAPSEPYPLGKCMAAGAAFEALCIDNNTEDYERKAGQIVFGIGKAVLMAMRYKRTEGDNLPDIHRDPDDPLTKKPVYPPSQEGFATPMHLLEGVLLGAFPLDYFGSLAVSTDDRIRAYGQLSFTRWYVEVQQNMQALEASGYTYEGNREIVAAIADQMEGFKTLFTSMPDWAKQVITTSRHDHRLSWRLQMLTPDDQALQRLCDAWSTHQTCPSVTIPVELSQKIDAYTHLGQRTRYVLAETRAKDPEIFAALVAGGHDPALFGDPTAGDVALVLNNVHEAREYFREAIRQQLDSNEAWGGFALTFLHEQSPAAQVLLRQPELVRDFYAKLADPAIAPEAAAAWLAPASMAELFQDSWPT